jgi:hypothetical protein
MIDRSEATAPSAMARRVYGLPQRRSDGRFDQDQCRAKYIAHLKEERKRSRRLAADAESTSAKAELIRIGIL